MKALLHRRGRAAAVVGGLVAAGATTVLVMVGTASAAEQGRCTDNVNVRSQPSATASVVTVCKRGTDVTIGERRNGYVQLTNLNGWASEQYVSANPGRTGSATTTKSTPTSSPTTSGSARGEQVRPTTPSATTTKTTSSSERRSTGSASPTTTAPRTTSSSQAPADTARDAGTSGGSQGGSDESTGSTPARSGLLG